MNIKKVKAIILASFLCILPNVALGNPTNTPKPTEDTGLPSLPNGVSKLDQAKFMFEACKNYTPQITYTPEYNPVGYPEIKALYFDSVDKNGRATKAFAYIGFPAGASASSPVPAVVLVHGSGGHPFAQWIKIWNDKGYAAIAFDHGAYKPTSVNGNWVRDTDGGAPEDALSTSSSALDQQWMYHAVAKTILANNILRADARVDSTKIGVTGISAGGYVLANLVGYDNRYAFAIPVYCFGYINESLSDRRLRYNEATYELWEGSVRFANATMPILIINSNCDAFASINTSSTCFDNLKNAELCIKDPLPHSHADGWAPAEIYRYTDSIVKNSQPLPKLLVQPDSQMGHNLKLGINVPPDIKKITVRVYYTTQALSYSSENKLEQSWKTVAGSYANGKITTTLPNDVNTYYVSICASVNIQNYYITSRLVSQPAFDNGNQNNKTKSSGIKNAAISTRNVFLIVVSIVAAFITVSTALIPIIRRKKRNK